MKLKTPVRILTTSVAALLAATALFPSTARADFFTYTGGIFTETFDNLGTTGLTTTSLTGAGSLPNDGVSPWFAGVVGAGTGNTTAAAVTTTAINVVSTGATAVVNPGARIFNNGETATINDRALGTGNTGGDPVIDLKVKNSATGQLSTMTLSFTTEYYRGGVQATAPIANPGYTLLYSPTGAASSWVSVPYTIPSRAATTSGADLDATLAANRFASGNISFTFPAAIATGGSFFLRFWDTNDPTNSPDANLAIDDFTFSAVVLGGALTYNLGHGVGATAPNGNLEVSANQYWLNGATPSGFSAGSIANFSQNPATTAAINVPADIATGQLNVSNATGAYIFSGAGKISGAFTKTGASTVTFASANSLSAATLDGGTTITQNLSALGASALTINSASTIQTDSDLTLGGGLNGAGVLTKTGAGTLTLGAAGTSTGTLNVDAGKVSTSVATGLGAATATVNLNNGTTLEYTATAGTTYAGNLNIGAAGGTINTIAVAETGASANGLTLSKAGGLTGSAPITKNGLNVLRISAAQAALTSNWTVTGGYLEATNATAFGSGAVTVTGGWTTLAGVSLANSITLNGGGLGVKSSSVALPIENYTGAINVAGNSFLSVKRSSTPNSHNGFFIGGVLSGSNSLTFVPPNEVTVGAGVPANVTTVAPIGVPNLTAATSATQGVTQGAVTLLNPANIFSGTFVVTSQQILSALPTGGTGDVFGASSFTLQGGAIRVLDNGNANNGTLNYNHAVTVATPSDAVNPGVATIFVDRQTLPAGAVAASNPSTQGTFTGNTVQFPSLSVPAGLGFRTDGVAANGYKVGISGATTINGAGAATFDIANAPLTLSGGLGGTAGLTKIGAGTLAVAGTVNYAGNTTVSAGTLDVAGATGAGITIGAGQTLSGVGTINGGVSVTTGTLAPGSATGVGTLTLSNLALSASSVVQYTWNAGTVGSANVTVSDGFVPTGAVHFNFLGLNPALGLHPLIDYVGTPLNNSVVNAFTKTTNSRIQSVFVNDQANTRVDLNVTGINYPIWSGSVSTEWSTATIGGAGNWNLSSGGSTDFLSNDKVVFDNSATAVSPTVNISVADVTPSEVIVDSTKNYTLQGAFGITGATTLVKNNTGTLTVTNTNSFTGAVFLNGGVTSVSTIADSAVNSTLGAGTTVNLATGGALEFTGATGSTNRAITVAATGGAVSAPTGSTLTLAGVVSGAGALEKKGAGTVILTGATNTPTSTTITAGTLQVGDGAVVGSIGTGAITNNATLAFNTPAAGLAVANLVTGTGGLRKTGAGNLTLNGAAVANTFSGDTVVDGGSLILSSTSGTNSVGGNVVVNAGATVAYGTTAGQLADHIPDSATVTINGGTFGSGAGATLAGPTEGVTDTVANVILNGGTFLSGRNTTAPVGPFTITGALTATNGNILLQRGGRVTSQAVTVSGGATVNFDGGTGAGASFLTVGAGGISLAGTTVNMNAGPSAVVTGSAGSVLVLNGNLTSTGTTTFNRLTPAVVGTTRADIDFNGGDRIFDVQGTLTLGTTADHINVVNTGGTPGGLIKTGAGNIVLAGANTFNGDTTVSQGTLTLTGTLSGSTNITSNALLDVTNANAGAGFTVGATQTLRGNGSVDGNTTINGTLAPGTGLGQLNLLDNVIFAAGGIGSFDINKTGVVRTSDLANVSGALTLAGTLNVTATGAALIQGDSFNLFDATTFAGTMAMGTMPTLNPGLFWSFDNLGVDGTISVVPEPGSAALLVLGSTLLFRRRRKA